MADTRFTLRGPDRILWQLGANSDGEITQVSIDNTRIADFDDMIIKEHNGGYWKFTATADGTIQYDPTTDVLDINRSIDYIPFVTSEGFFMKMRLINGLLRMFETEDRLADPIPHPNGVLMSNEGSTQRLIHDGCGLATVTPRADFGLWCGSCNKYVLPEHTNFLVILDE